MGVLFLSSSRYAPPHPLSLISLLPSLHILFRHLFPPFSAPRYIHGQTDHLTLYKCIPNIVHSDSILEASDHGKREIGQKKRKEERKEEAESGVCIRCRVCVCVCVCMCMCVFVCVLC